MTAYTSIFTGNTSRIIPLPGPAKVKAPGVTALICPCTEGWHVIPFDEISHCTAEGNYVRIYFGKAESVVASKTLRSVEELLPRSTFVKCHQSHLVATQRIRLMTNLELTLENGTRLPISRNRKSHVREALLTFGVRLE